MTVIEWVQLSILLLAIVVSLTVSGYVLIKATREGFTIRWTAFLMLALGLLFVVYLAYTAREIHPADGAQIMLVTGLVAVTGVHALSASRQADASVKMAEEMRHARFPAIKIGWIGPDSTEEKVIAVFKNTGLGPALNLKCYLAHDTFNFQYKDVGYTVMEVGEEHTISFPRGNFDFKERAGLGINCDYRSVYGESFRSILRFEAGEESHFEIIEIKEGK